MTRVVLLGFSRNGHVTRVVLLGFTIASNVTMMLATSDVEEGLTFWVALDPGETDPGIKGMLAPA